MNHLNLVVEPHLEAYQLSVEQANQLLSIQNTVLESIVTGHDYQAALEMLCHAAEAILPQSIASIMLFDDDAETLKVRAAPNVPGAAISLLNLLIPGENAGSCGTAVYSGKPQYVKDTLKDKRWGNLRGFAKDFNIKSCWSMPIIDGNNQVIGSFALSSFEKREPNHFQEILLYTASYLASLVLMRENEDETLQKAAHFDHLTQLPNRTNFERRVTQAISKAKRNNGVLSIFFIDLDEFKQINDIFGHAEGDKILIHVADCMLECTRKEDTLARLGGDEFVILIEGVSDKSELSSIAEKLLSEFSTPLQTKTNRYHISGSIGISRYPAQGKTVQTLVKSADKAMYAAKASGKNKFRFSC